MADLYSNSRGYGDPAIAKGFDNIAKAFSPPSLQDIYAGAKAKEAQQKMQGVAAMYGLAKSADMSPEARTQFDRYNAATGSGNMSTGYYGVDTKAATDMRGQNITSGDNRYHTDVGASTARRGQDMDDSRGRYGIDTKSKDERYGVDARSASELYKTDADNTNRTKVATIDQRGQTDRTMLAPVAEGSTRFVPPDLAQMYNVPGTQRGNISAKQGEQVTLPDDRVISGATKPPTEEEVKGAILKGLPPEAQNRVVTGQHPAQIYNYKSPDGKGGSAVFDPSTGGFVDSQTRQALPSGIAIQSAGAPAAQVNIDSSGTQYGAPEKGYAYVRTPDGKLKLGANGAPMQAPMEGGPEFAKVKKAGDAETNAANDKGVTSDIMTQDIDRALATIKGNPALTTGLGSQALGGVGGTAATDLHALLDGLKSNISLERLQALRDASPTGAALGRVTNQEINLLASGHGSLAQSQSADQLTDNLKRIKNLTLDTIHGKGNGPARETLGFQQPTAEEAAAELARRRGGAK